MKTKFFRKIKFPLLGRGLGGGFLLLWGLGGGCVLFAQNGVTVSEFAINAGTATFNVQWTNDHAPDFVWSDTVWVWVDYNNAGKMERLPLLPGATLTATSPGGKVIEEADNNKGVWVAGNARTNSSFSATVKLLTEVKDAGGACVYASNYPPVGKYSKNDASEIKFTGTPEYDVALLHESGNLITQTTDSPLHVPASYTVYSFTDKTAAPGKLACIPSTVYELTASALSLCEGGAGVTFSLSGTDAGRVYRLYKDGTTVVSTLTGDGNAATFCEAVTEVGTYTARAAALPEYCPAVMTGTHELRKYPLPSITHRSGSTSQTVNLNTAITAIVYTASDAATISRRSGSYPSGVSGTSSGSSFTISGTPSVAGTFSYALAAAASGCTSTLTAGTITVLPGTFTISSTGGPNTAYTTNTWSIGTGSSALTWSDRVAKTACTNSATFTPSDIPTANYTVANGIYYYSWTCVNNNASLLCPAPWRVPSRDDYRKLLLAVGGADAARVLSTMWGTTKAKPEIGWVGGAMAWTQTSAGDEKAYYFGTLLFVGYDIGSTEVNHGIPVRCVK